MTTGVNLSTRNSFDFNQVGLTNLPEVPPPATTVVAQANNGPKYYQVGDAIGTDYGKMIFQGVGKDGYYHVAGHKQSYRIPADLHTADEIRGWVIRQLKAGNINRQDLYQDQGKPSNPFDQIARIPVPGTNLNIGDVSRNIGNVVQNMPIPGVGITPKQAEQVIQAGQQQINRTLHPYGDVKPWQGQLGGAQLTATPVAIEGKQITWRIQIERGGEKLGTIDTKLSGQLGPAQFTAGSPLKKKLTDIVNRPRDKTVIAKGNGQTFVTHLQEQQGMLNGRLQTTGYIAKGVDQYSDKPLNNGQKPEKYGYFASSAPGKTRLVTNANGQAITDPQKAEARAKELLLNRELTTNTVQQTRTAADYEKMREASAIRLQNVGPQKIKAPGLDYSNNPNLPNRIAGGTFDPNKVERGAFNVSLQSESKDGTPNFSAMIVPNVVFEQGPKKAAGKPLNFVGVTPQPLTGFFPVSGGFPGFHTETEGHALYRSTLHPAGFYPGDPNWQRWNDAYVERPESTPEYQVGNFGYTKKITTENWWQVYWNSPNLLTPLTWGSVNARAIKERGEVRAGLYEEQTTALGRNSSQMLLTPYSWEQAHVKIGVGDAALPTRAPYGAVGLQEEVGVYLYQTNTPVSSPVGSVDLSKLKTKDWHIVNGSITDDAKAFKGEFSEIEKNTGLAFHSESVVPDWNDRSAGVYLRVPSDGAGTAEWAKTVNEGLIEVRNERYLPVAKLTQMLQNLGNQFDGKYKEFKFLTKDSLLRLNQDRLVKLKDPKSGQEVLAFKAGTWINTGARVSVGGPGLFLPADNGNSSDPAPMNRTSYFSKKPINPENDGHE